MKKVLIISTMSIASEVLANRTAQAVKKRNLPVEITLMPEKESMELLHKFDILLLSPHLRFLLGNPDGLGNLPVEVINSVDFGNLNGSAVADAIENMLGETEKRVLLAAGGA